MSRSVNLALMRRDGDVHASVFIEPASFIKKHLSLRGWDVSVTDNCFSHDLVNIVFGAHAVHEKLRFDTARKIIFNLEPLGVGSYFDTFLYREFLKSSVTIDYHVSNISYYNHNDKPERLRRGVFNFSNAGYAIFDSRRPVRERSPILLFFGSLNNARLESLRKVVSAGVDLRVISPSKPSYGADRDRLIINSRAVLNIPYYENGPLEQVRLFHVLSLGTPVISHIPCSVPDAYSRSITWVSVDVLEEFFKTTFRTDNWSDEAECQLEAWRQTNSDLDCQQLEEMILYI